MDTWKRTDRKKLRVVFTYKIQVPKTKVCEITHFLLLTSVALNRGKSCRYWMKSYMVTLLRNYGEHTGEPMHWTDWCTNLICNHQFVHRNYKLYYTSVSIRNKTRTHSITDRGLCTLHSVRCTSAHTATKRNDRTSRSSEQFFCFVFGMSQVQTSARRLTIRVFFVV
jgi:hypothetical protein